MGEFSGFYSGGISRVIDGDTVDVVADVGFYVHVEVRVRLRNVYAPEMGSKVGLRCAEKLLELCPPGGFVKMKTYKAEKYGRWIADLWRVENKKEVFVNDEMRRFILDIVRGSSSLT